MNTRNILVTLECFIRRDDGKYLMLHRNTDKKIMPNVWMGPGGKREFNEGLFEATRREVLEETGLTIKNLFVKVAETRTWKILIKSFISTLFLQNMRAVRFTRTQRMANLYGFFQRRFLNWMVFLLKFVNLGRNFLKMMEEFFHIRRGTKKGMS